jgi:molybdenum cofactor synthesis domain-containing protein
MLKVAVVTVSDRAAGGVYDDVSGPTLVQIIKEMGAEVVAAHLVPDEPEQIQTVLRRLTDEEDVHLILTTGGTGPAPRDHTPEATKAVIEREMPGLAELLRRDGSRRTPWAALGRGVAGIRGRTLIINLPGNPRAVQEGMETLAPLLPPTVSLMRGGPFYPEMTAAECCEVEGK